MKDYIVKDPWKIIEDAYIAEHNQITESLMSLGNGQMGQRANFEEQYSGETLQGSYVAGVYYPDKTRVGWWKIGYPDYFAKVLNSCNWIGIDIRIAEEILDLAKVQTVHRFRRELDMQSGILHREMEVTMAGGHHLTIISKRFVSMATKELGCISYEVRSHNYTGPIEVKSYLDFDVVNQDRNYEEIFWEAGSAVASDTECYVEATTRKTNYVVGVAMSNTLFIDNVQLVDSPEYKTTEKQSYAIFASHISPGSTLTLHKRAAITSTMYHSAPSVKSAALAVLHKESIKPWDTLVAEQKQAWSDIWTMCDITIDGDLSAQQAIRFNIFQLYQTYTGHDDRLNIGPKGFTGEKYGGSTYWDTEAYCLPFYLSTADQQIGRNLLIYRYKQLGKAIENAEKLGFSDGAALYPMVTMTGEECHNEWEITFEEIHRNGAIAYAIYDYVNYTGDQAYLEEYGLEVLIAISRFWAQRFNWSEKRKKYVMLGVTGPNEYENNINNNWYTSYIACWCLRYTKETISKLQSEEPKSYTRISEKTAFSIEETSTWTAIIDHVYLPSDEDLGIFLQQDNYLDKEQILVTDLDPAHRPINQNWSWDRILRSCFIKQADVLQGMYFFEDDFTAEEHKRNFLFYEPRTVHESSLSPCVHGILASKLGMHEKAYEMYLRTARLDLDDYNNDTEDGCHITSMAGTWLAIIKGFAGQRVKDGVLTFTSALPSQWAGLSFKMKYRKNLIEVKMDRISTVVSNLSGPELEIIIDKKHTTLPSV